MPKNAVAYTALVEDAEWGNYLWTPQDCKKFRSGAVGYFNREGDWSNITNLTDPKLDDSGIKWKEVGEPLACDDPYSKA